jgi:hypothetical protein
MNRRMIAALGFAVAFFGTNASAQLTLFLDFESNSTCDLVNASNTELAVLDETLELVVIDGLDVVLEGTFVDCDGTVLIDGVTSGFIGYAEDGDGFASLWWLSDFGTVLELDFVTFLPFDSGLFPSDFFDVPCDACYFWDDFTCTSFFADFDGDGVEDFLDFCCDSPIDELVDVDGCSCSELDDDQDGVENCYDLCNNTPFGALIDSDGCEAVVFIDDGGANLNGVSLMCGSFSTLSLAMMVAGLASFRTSRRRFR